MGNGAKASPNLLEDFARLPGAKNIQLISWDANDSQLSNIEEKKNHPFSPLLEQRITFNVVGGSVKIY